MNKISLDLQPIYNTQEVDFLGSKIEIKKYLPMEQKLNIAEIVLQECVEFNFVNPIRVEAFFNIMVCIKYTNIDLSEHLDNVYKLYDIVETNGLLQKVIDTSFEDYNELKMLIEELVSKFEKHENSISGVINRTLLDLPEKLREAMSELDNLDTTKLLNVFDEVLENGGDKNAIVQAIVSKGQK